MAAALLTAFGLAAAIYARYGAADPLLPPSAGDFMIGWLALATLLGFLVLPRYFDVGFLLGLLCLLVGWRIGGFYGLRTVWLPLLGAFLLYLGMFFQHVRADMKASQLRAFNASQWQLAFLRIYAGFDMVPHFTEKLFAGPGPFMEDVKAFAAFGLPAPEAMVTLGGFCELGIAIGIGCGVLTRLAGLGAPLYFLIATLIGGHFRFGFIWASAGGGWEYPVLMMVIFLSYAWRGAGRFSIDGALLEAGRMPDAVRVLAARRESRFSGLREAPLAGGGR